MNVGQLKKYLENFSDDMLVLTPHKDHSYRHINAYPWKVVPENSRFVGGVSNIFYEPDVDESGIDVIIIE